MPTLKKLIGVYVMLEMATVALQWAAGPTSIGRHYFRPLSSVSRHSLEQLIADQSTYVRYSRELGWTLRANATSQYYHANSAALRSTREYSPRVRPPGTRIAAFGDSFTHGDDVPGHVTWPALLEQRGNDLEVLNFGVPGYGIDQALLRYQTEGHVWSPDIVLIGFMSEDLGRHVNTYRPFLQASTAFPLSKPRFVLEDGKLSLRVNPISHVSQYAHVLRSDRRFLESLGTWDWFYRRRTTRGPLRLLLSAQLFDWIVRPVAQPTSLATLYKQELEPYRITLMLVNEFAQEALRAGSLPIFIFFTSRDDASRPLYQPIRQSLESFGYITVDTAESVSTLDERNSRTPSGHLSAAAHGRVATVVHDTLLSTHVLEAFQRRHAVDVLTLKHVGR